MPIWCTAIPIGLPPTSCCHCYIWTPHRYPNIKFIVPHLGGPISMPLNRLDQQGQHDLPDLAEAPSVTAKKFWYDTVRYGSKAAFTCALEAFGADHVVTGSDYPMLQDYEEYKETFAYIERLDYPRPMSTRSSTTTPRHSSASGVSIDSRFRIGFAMELREAGDVVA
jgi:hypothetical protein